MTRSLRDPHAQLVRILLDEALRRYMPKVHLLIDSAAWATTRLRCSVWVCVKPLAPQLTAQSVLVWICCAGPIVGGGKGHETMLTTVTSRVAPPVEINLVRRGILRGRPTLLGSKP